METLIEEALRLAEEMPARRRPGGPSRRADRPGLSDERAVTATGRAPESAARRLGRSACSTGEDVPRRIECCRPRPGRERLRRVAGRGGRAGPVAARRRDVGLRARRRAAALCYAGANLVPVERRRRGASASSPTEPAGQGRRCSSIVGPRRRWSAPAVASRWGRPGAAARDVRPQPAADGDRRADPTVAGRPAGAPGRPGRARTSCCRRRDRDVHRGGRRLAGRRPTAATALPRPGQRARAAGPGVRPDRGRPGACSRPSSARSPGGVPDPGRLGRARRCAAEGSPPPAMAAVVELARDRSRRSSASTSTTSTSRPARAYERVGFASRQFATVHSDRSRRGVLPLAGEPCQAAS